MKPYTFHTLYVSAGRHSHSGVGMVELLIALLVFSTGLLGLVASQSQSINYNRDAFYRTQSTFLAQDIIDRIRASGGRAECFAAATSSEEASIPTSDSSCRDQSFANAEMRSWKANVGNTLPAGDASITQSTERQFRVEVRWQQKPNEERSIAVEFVP